MKKTLAVVAMFIAMILVPALFAQTVVEVNKNNGDVRISDPSWSRSDIVIDENVLSSYGNEWIVAYDRPDKVVTLESHDIFARDGFFHVKKTLYTETGIVYNTGAKRIQIVHNISGETEIHFSFFLIWWTLSLAMATFACYRGDSPNVVPYKFLLVFLLTVLTAVSGYGLSILASITAAAALFAIMIYLLVDRKRRGWIFSTLVALYFTSMLASLVFFIRS
jgi:hypothetical protein